MTDNKSDDVRSTRADLTTEELTTAIEIATAEVAGATSRGNRGQGPGDRREEPRRLPGANWKTKREGIR